MVFYASFVRPWKSWICSPKERRLEGLRGYMGLTGLGNAGVTVAGEGDCDGDQEVDVGVASIQADPLGRTNAGEIFLVLGDGSIGGNN